jgi:hypothetical protein
LISPAVDSPRRRSPDLISSGVALPKRKIFIWIGAILGAIGPLLYYTSPAVKDYILGDGVFVWPTGILIIVAYGHRDDLFEYTVIAISIAANIALFAWIAGLLWLGLSKIWGGGKSTPS